VADQDRIVRKRLVEIVAVQQPAVRHGVVVVAVGHDRLALRHVRVVPQPGNGRDDRLHVLAGTGGRRVDVGLLGDGERRDVVAVRVQEPRQQRLAREVDDVGRGTAVGLFDLGTAAKRHDLAAGHRQRLGRRLLVVDGDDVTAEIERVRRLLRRGSWRRRARRLAAAAGAEHEPDRTREAPCRGPPPEGIRPHTPSPARCVVPPPASPAVAGRVPPGA
jgi:hypothetical protein